MNIQAPFDPEFYQENEARLAGCAEHDFRAHRGPTGGLRRGPSKARWRCSRCDGEVSGTARLWYWRGLQHGRAAQGVETSA